MKEQVLVNHSSGPFEDREARAVDRILAQFPLQLPRQMAAGSDASAVYRRLGIGLLAKTRGNAVTVPVELPPGWTCRRAGHRGIKVYDQAQQAVLEAFYKLIPPVPRAHAQLTAHGAELLGGQRPARYRWRELLRRARRRVIGRRRPADTAGRQPGSAGFAAQLGPIRAPRGTLTRRGLTGPIPIRRILAALSVPAVAIMVLIGSNAQGGRLRRPPVVFPYPATAHGQVALGGGLSRVLLWTLVDLAVLLGAYAWHIRRRRRLVLAACRPVTQRRYRMTCNRPRQHASNSGPRLAPAFGRRTPGQGGRLPAALAKRLRLPAARRAGDPDQQSGRLLTDGHLRLCGGRLLELHQSGQRHESRYLPVQPR